MLYLKGNGLKIIVLERSNIEEILKGRPAKTSDGSVLIAFTPDPVWLADKIMDCDGEAAEIGRLIDESMKRPEKPTKRKTHKPFTKDFQ